jgi:TetR/AcrR family transcriptional regulator
MNEIKKDNTEEKILNAAQNVFIKKGMDGARMQEIADEAGINKALLHYYFRTKQKLFEAIFSELFKQIFPNLEMLIKSDKPIELKLSDFIERYIEVLLRNPFLPAFILKEINRDPDFFASIFKEKGIDPSKILEMFEKEMEAGNIVKMNPKDLIINMLSLSLFPFAAKPLMQLMLFENNTKAYNQFLKERKTTVKDFVLNSILLK